MKNLLKKIIIISNLSLKKVSFFSMFIFCVTIHLNAQNIKEEKENKALFRIDISEDRSVKIYDMDGNLIDNSKVKNLKHFEEIPQQSKNLSYKKNTTKEKPSQIIKESKQSIDLKYPKKKDTKEKDKKQEKSKPFSCIAENSQNQYSSFNQIKLTNGGAINNNIDVLNNKTLPDLEPFRPDNDDYVWDDVIVLKNTTVETGLQDMHNDTITYGDDIYVALSYWNNSNETISTSFRIQVLVDEVEQYSIYQTDTIYGYWYWMWWNSQIYDLSPGQHTIKMIIDADNEIDESDETNNEYSRTFFIYSDQPNLTCVPENSTLTVDGTTVGLSITVINDGNASIGSSELGYYLSEDNKSISTSDYLIGTDYVTSLSSGSTSVESINIDVITISPTIPVGTYYVGFIIDHLEQVAESDETDNAWYFSSPQVTISGQPNLTRISGNSSLTVDGTNVDLSLTVINDGNASANSSELAYYLCDSSFSTEYLIGTDYVTSLSPGATSNENIYIDVITVSPTIPAGIYYVTYIIDYLEQVAESDETDNAWYFSSPQVTISSGQPNLTQVSGNASLTVNGTTVDLSLTVINDGNASAGSSELAYYLCDTTFTTEYLIGTDYVTSLSPGVTSNESIYVDVATISPTIPAGIYYVIYIIDHLEQVAESDETDNAWYFSSPQVIISGDQPNLMLYTGTGSENTCTYNSTTQVLDVTNSVGNDGDANAGGFRTGWYLSENTTLTTDDYLIATATQNSLLSLYYVNISVSVDFNYISGIPSGTYYVGVYIDDLDAISESNEADNAAYFTPPFNIITGIDEELSHLPDKITLYQNYPNPFIIVTNITFSIQQKTHVTLNIYNITGQLIHTLINQNKEPGTYLVKWNASNVPSGIYFYRLRVGNNVVERKCVIIN
ncbi:MAG: T9SS type A sorting domain-containing protein [Bacteroidales bacterium]|nr:T9SS type A sorting domain-containing protein [Bacteroidales bacterium]